MVVFKLLKISFYQVFMQVVENLVQAEPQR